MVKSGKINGKEACRKQMPMAALMLKTIILARDFSERTDLKPEEMGDIENIVVCMPDAV